jgi:hypothetical protein
VPPTFPGSRAACLVPRRTSNTTIVFINQYVVQ